MAAGIPGGYSRYKVVVLPIYHAGRYTRYNAIILRSACDAADQGGKLTVIDVSKRFCFFWHDARLDSQLLKFKIVVAVLQRLEIAGRPSWTPAPPGASSPLQAAGSGVDSKTAAPSSTTVPGGTGLPAGTTVAAGEESPPSGGLPSAPSPPPPAAPGLRKERVDRLRSPRSSRSASERTVSGGRSSPARCWRSAERMR